MFSISKGQFTYDKLNLDLSIEHRHYLNKDTLKRYFMTYLHNNLFIFYSITRARYFHINLFHYRDAIPGPIRIKLKSYFYLKR